MKFNKLIPELSVSNLQESIHFYINILGFTLKYERKENKFLFISLGEIQIMLQEIDFENDNWETGKLEYPFGRGINFQLEVDNVEKIYEVLQKHNIPIKSGIMENWYRQDNKLLGNKEFLVLDPDGYLLRFSEDLGEKGI